MSSFASDTGVARPRGPAVGFRTAFQQWLVHDHKAPGTAITALAIDYAGERMYCGLTDGQIEEYKIYSDFNTARVSISARKFVGKRPVVVILHLPHARCLGVVCEGSMTLLDSDTLEGHVLAGVRNVTAAAVDLQSPAPPCMAVAQKNSKKSVRLVVYEVYANSSHSSSGRQRHTALVTRQLELPETGAATGLAWVGQNIVLAVGLRYLLLRPGSGTASLLFEVSEQDLSPMMVLPLPASEQAVLLLNEVGVVCDSAGRPSSAALTFPGPPLALAQAGLFVLAVFGDGVHVYDRASSQCVQVLDFGNNLRPAPGQVIHTAYSGRGNAVAVSGLRKVWLLLPVALQDQAKQLLSRRKMEQALALLETCVAEGADWADEGYAQAALLMLQELRFEEAAACLARVPLTVFQPCQLFPLFPEHTSRWRLPPPPPLPAAATLGGGGDDDGLQQQQLYEQHVALLRGKGRSYWGLTPPPAELEGSVRATLLARMRGSRGGGQGGIDDLALEAQVAQRCMEAKRCLVRYLQQVRSLPEVVAPRQVHTLVGHLLMDTGQPGALQRLVAEPGGVLVEELEPRLLVAGEAEEGSRVSGSEPEGGGVDVGPSGTDAAAAGSGGVVGGGGGGGGGGSSGSIGGGGGGGADGAGSAPWRHALALMYARHGQAAAALAVWRGLTEQGGGGGGGGGRDASASGEEQAANAVVGPGHRQQQREQEEEEEEEEEGAEVRADVPTEGGFGSNGGCSSSGGAVRCAADLMADESRVGEGLALEYLPWLLRVGGGGRAGGAALRLLTSRRLPPASVLAPLEGARGRSALRLAYLQHLVGVWGCQDGRYHTELALCLAAAAHRLMSHQGSSSRGSGSGGVPTQPSSGLNAEGHASSATAAPASISGGQVALGTSDGAQQQQQQQDQRERRQQQEGGSSSGRDAAGGRQLADLRSRLQSLLQVSELYDRQRVLHALRGTQLWREQVVLQCKLGDHAAALRLLALTIGDVDAAIAYCGEHAGGQAGGGYLLLLDLLLNPPPSTGDGSPSEPRLRDACRLLAAQGAQLDPLHVLRALRPDTPLHAALPTLERLLRERLHRQRTALLTRNLQRSQHLQLSAMRAEAMAQRVVVTEERACSLCHTRIGTKMFALLPGSGVLLCFRCYRDGAAAAAAAKAAAAGTAHVPDSTGNAASAAAALGGVDDIGPHSYLAGGVVAAAAGGGKGGGPGPPGLLAPRGYDSFPP